MENDFVSTQTEEEVHNSHPTREGDREIIVNKGHRGGEVLKNLIDGLKFHNTI